MQARTTLLTRFGKYKYPLLIMIAFNIADMISTLAGLSLGCTELNPVAGFTGMPSFMVIKFLMPFLIWLEIDFVELHPRIRKVVEFPFMRSIGIPETLWICNGLFLMVLVNNLCKLYIYRCLAG